jgi:small-conductance mechanosensitive channel
MPRVVRSDKHDYDLHELSVQVARVKEKTRPWKETIALVLAIGAAVVSHNAAQIFKQVAEQTISQLPTIIAYVLAVVFCALATIAVLGISGKAQNYLRPHLGSSHAAVVRYAIVLVGIVVVLVLTLQLCRVPVGQLVVGGALTSVLLAVAAQQSLSNIFAGMVLLLSRPFRVGDHIRLRAGALGGELEGTVTEIGITYIRLDTGETVMSVPNSQVLAAAVGPVPVEPAAGGLPAGNNPVPANPAAPEDGSTPHATSATPVTAITSAPPATPEQVKTDPGRSAI